MEQTTSTKTLDSNSPINTQNKPILPSHSKKNIYPAIRHTLLVVAVLFTLCIIFFLIHQNGKSIYDNGL